MLKFKVVIYKRAGMRGEEFRRHLRDVQGPLANRLPGRRRYVQNHVRADRKRNFPGWNPVIELYLDDWAAMESCLGKSGRELPQTPTCRPLPSSRAQLGLWSTRLWFWNNHQEVIHLVALDKVILLQQLVARL